jgi:hypothetical protein
MTQDGIAGTVPPGRRASTTPRSRYRARPRGETGEFSCLLADALIECVGVDECTWVCRAMVVVLPSPHWRGCYVCAVWDAGCGASVRGPLATRVMVWGLPVASDHVHMAGS